jgi:hypothetical protein
MINSSSNSLSNYTIFKRTKEKFAPNTIQTPANSKANSYANSFKSYDFLNTAPLDRTKLYGSLLDNIEDVIKNMTEPPQKFYKTQMQLNDYQDIIS